MVLYDLYTCRDIHPATPVPMPKILPATCIVGTTADSPFRKKTPPCELGPLLLISRPHNKYLFFGVLHCLLHCIPV